MPKHIDCICELKMADDDVIFHRPECEDWRYDWYQLFWDECSQVRDHEGLGHQSDCRPLGWSNNQNSPKAEKILSGIQPQQSIRRVRGNTRSCDRRYVEVVVQGYWTVVPYLSPLWVGREEVAPEPNADCPILLATLKLAIVPEDFSVAVVTFPSIRDAASAAAGVMQAGIPVAAMEIMDEVQMKVVNLGGATAPRVWKETPTLFFKFAGTKAGVKEHISLVQKITKSNKGGNFEFAKDAKEQKLLWSARKESLWSMLSLRKEGEEVCKCRC